jgi:Restriction endonuclease fold toxin 2
MFMGSTGGFQVDTDTVFRSSVQFLDTKDFVYDIAAGVAGDLAGTAGMAGDDTTAHSFAAKYEPAATTIVQAIGKAGQGMAAISSRLLTMAVGYLNADDAAARSFTGNINTSSALQPGPQGCDPSQAHQALPMVTGSKQVHEIPIIGKFWPQGDPDKLRHAAQVWDRCASLIDTAQGNGAQHAAPVVEHCSGEAFDAFAKYAGTIYAGKTHGGTDVSDSAPLMENISAACRRMRNACNDYADAIDTCRGTLIAIGVGAGLVTTAGVLLSIFTLGGSNAAAAAGDAALAGEAAAAAETLATVEAGSAAAAAVAEAEAIVSSLAARLVVTTVVAGAGVASATVPANAAPAAGLPAAGSAPVGGVGPVPPPVPPAFPLYDPAQQAAAATWVQGLPARPPNYGTSDDRAYQVRVAGQPERQMPGANGEAVWADGFRPADGAIIDAKNVRKQGCSPRSLDGLQEGAFNTTMMLGKDESELGRYQAAIANPANHAQYLEIDTPDPSTVGYWQYLAAANHVKNNVRVVP